MITAIVLAAGLSSRMGRLKPLLPWGRRTVIEHILEVLQTCPVDEVLVITGHEHERIAQRLAGTAARVRFNADYAAGEMLSSIQVGLRSASPGSGAALIALGDQPALPGPVVGQIVEAYRGGLGSIIAPSYRMRRGHPMLIDRRHWGGILELGSGGTLREFMRSAGDSIHHVDVATPDVLQDMDTPDDYRRELEVFQNTGLMNSGREAQEV